MDEQSARSLYEQRTTNLISSLLPNGAGTISEARLRYALDNVAQVAFSAGHDFALSNLGRKAGSQTSDAKRKASAENGKKGGRKRRCHECKIEIKPGDSWERHSYGKGRYLYCSNCAERIRQEEYETERHEGYYYP